MTTGVIFLLLLIWAGEIAVGAAIGSSKGRTGEGAVWGFVLGVIGWIVIACRSDVRQDPLGPPPPAMPPPGVSEEDHQAAVRAYWDRARRRRSRPDGVYARELRQRQDAQQWQALGKLPAAEYNDSLRFRGRDE